MKTPYPAWFMEHEPTPGCTAVHCHWHNVDEFGDGFIRCFECGHLYRTGAELRRRYRARLREATRPAQMRGAWLELILFNWLPQLWPWWPRIRTIYFCQECSHDF